jgi:hypothetical protein
MDRFGLYGRRLVDVAMLAADIAVGNAPLRLRRVFLTSMRGREGVADGVGAEERRKRQEGNQT